MRTPHRPDSLKLPQNGAPQVRDQWYERFAETPDVLKSTHRQQTLVPVLDLEIGGDEFIAMAGPCSVETEFQLMATANHVRRAGARILRGGAFKPRSSPYAFQGHGLEGLKMLARARQESGLAIVTEVMSEEDVPLVAEYADILQIGTRNMENYPLLEAAARSGRPVLLKRGMVATIAEFLRSAQLILDNGNPNVILCERGIRTFETALRNTFDVAAIALLKQISHLPVIADPSHAAGHRDLVPALARIAVAAGADGLLVEVHPNPDKAWSDGDQSLDFRGFDEMMAGLEPWLALRGLLAEPKKADRGISKRPAAGARAMEAVG
jgi:3-deoxy-7-phosphoheptulonate synthase